MSALSTALDGISTLVAQLPSGSIGAGGSAIALSQLPLATLAAPGNPIGDAIAGKVPAAANDFSLYLRAWFNGLPTTPDGLPSRAPWRNGDTLAFAT